MTQTLADGACSERPARPHLAARFLEQVAATQKDVDDLKWQLRRQHGGRNEDEIEDALQEAFTAAYEHLRSTDRKPLAFSHKSLAFGWVGRVASNQLVNRHRRLERETPLPDTNAAFRGAADPSADPSSSVRG
jgi:DNA-directed RNA polymerase specialized sigma24 family protein